MIRCMFLDATYVLHGNSPDISSHRNYVISIVTRNTWPTWHILSEFGMSEICTENRNIWVKKHG